MLNNNPFSLLAEIVSPLAMQGFIVAMVFLIAVGTIVQMIHHKNLTYFLNNAKKAKLSATKELGIGEKTSIIAKTTVNNISINSEQIFSSQTAIPTATDTKTPNLNSTKTPVPNPIGNSRKSFLSTVLYEQQQENDHIRTFGKGAAYSIFTFLTLGFYLQLRRFLRPYLRRLLRNIRNDLRRS